MSGACKSAGCRKAPRVVCLECKESFCYACILTEGHDRQFKCRACVTHEELHAYEDCELSRRNCAECDHSLCHQCDLGPESEYLHRTITVCIKCCKICPHCNDRYSAFICGCGVPICEDCDYDMFGEHMYSVGNICDKCGPPCENCKKKAAVTKCDHCAADVCARCEWLGDIFNTCSKC